MRAYLVYELGKKHQAAAMTALARGMAGHGVTPTIATDYAGLESHDVIVCWGDRAPVKDRPRLMLEAGYINGAGSGYIENRLRFISTSWNGLHGRADNITEYPPDRWEALGIKLEPWRAVGDYVLVLDQCPGDAQAPDMQDWHAVLRSVKHKWKRYKKRNHPLMGNTRPLARDLAGAAVCVTWNSTAAVESVIAGIPTVTLDDGAIARPVTSHSIFDPLYIGPREQWAYNLAYRQWSLDELTSGVAWDAIK